MIITLDTREGGYVHFYVGQARRWKMEGQSLLIAGDQFSAAALQIVYAVRLGIVVFWRPRFLFAAPRLYFHASRIDGLPNPEADALALQLLGPEFARKIGPLPVHGWRRMRPQDFGIPRESGRSRPGRGR